MSRPPRAVTIYDVAQLAGVSTSTVSRVVNGRRVDEAMAERVQTAIRETGFQPNLLARSLYLQQSRMLGFVLPDISNPFFATLFMAIERQALDHGYTLLLGNTLNDLTLEARHLRIMSERQVDGLILAGGRINEVNPSAELLADTERIQKRTPLVMVNGELPGMSSSAVQVDELEGVRDATRHLLNLGHTRILFLGGVPNVRATRQKRAAFAEEHLAAGVAPGQTLDSSYELAAGAEAMRSVLAGPRSQWPTAILGINDPVAVGAAHVAVGAGLRIPADLSVVGFDDTPLASTFYPPLTTVSHRYETLARLTLETVLQTMQGERVQRSVTPELVVRASTAAPR
ncbi:LacI family DNA-binding transcriptional regulator [Deinococcus altitudinis]|uniref:LacI family DNA-binding transcriptional regulator n=1 Tax=Deinococcus altitudinis TaxID=468914 RepID=UPI0038920476